MHHQCKRGFLINITVLGDFLPSILQVLFPKSLSCQKFSKKIDYQLFTSDKIQELMGRTPDKTTWLQLFKQGQNSAFKWLYDTYREPFVNWVVNQHQCSKEEAADIFQDSIIVFYKNVQRGKITTLKSSIKTYLFGIGKNLLLHHFRAKKGITTDLDKVAPLLFDNEQLPYEKLHRQERSQMIASLLQRMKDPCRSLILLFYFNRLSIRDIAEQMNYNSTDVVKTQKKRCVKRLRDYVDRQFDEL